MNNKYCEDNNVTAKIIIFNVCFYMMVSLFITLLFKAVEESSIFFIIVYIPLIIIGIIGIVISGSAEIDYNGFKIKTMIGKFYIKWNDIEYVKVYHGMMMIENSKQRLPYFAPGYWGGRDAYKALEIFNNVLTSKSIHIEKSIKAVVPIYYGTKLK